MLDKIVVHEDRSEESGVAWQRRTWARNGLGSPPVLGKPVKTTPAWVDHGRWVAACPEGCGYAILVSEREPYLLCAEGGKLCNGGQWVRVVFPAERAEIEAELLKRPARHPMNAPTRNWIPGETVGDLVKERLAHEPQGGR